MAVRKTLKRMMVLSAAIAAALSQSVHIALADSVYTGGGTGTSSTPSTGVFSTGFTPGVTAGGAASLVLDFSNSGTNAYTATDDLAGALSLNSIQLDLDGGSGGTGLGTIATGTNSLNFVSNGTTTPTILEDGTNPFTFTGLITATNLLTLGVGTAGPTNPFTPGLVTLSSAVTNTGGITVSGGNYQIGGVISGAGALNVTGGTLNLENGTALVVNTFTGAVNISGGVLGIVGQGNADPTNLGGGVKNVNITNGGILRLLNGTSADPSAGTKTFNFGTGGGTIDTGTGTFTLNDGTGAAAQLQGAGTLTKIGTGTLTLGQTGAYDFSAFTGSVVLNAGTTLAVGATALGLNTSGTATVNTGAILDMQGQNAAGTTNNKPLVLAGGTLQNSSANPITNGGTVTLSAATPINTSGAGGITLNGVISDAAGGVLVTKSGANALTLGGANTFAGGVSVTAGTLRINNTAGSATGTGNVALASSTFLTSSPGSTAAAISGTVTGPASGATATIAPGGVFANGALNSTVGTLNLGGLNATAQTTLNFDLTTPSGSDDTINVTSLNGLSTTGAVPITLGQLPSQPGTFRLITFNSTTAGGGLAGTFTAPSATGNGRLTYTVTVDPGATNQYFVDLNATGTGGGVTYVFVGNSAPAGDSWTVPANYNPPNDGTTPGIAGDLVTINNGSAAAYTINLNGQQHVGSLTFANSGAGSYTLAPGGGTLFLDTGTTTAATLTNSTNNNSITAPVVLASNATVTVASAANTLTLGGVVSGAGSLTLPAANTGTLLLSGANTYTGGTTVNGGTVKLGAATGLGTAAVVVGSGGTLDLNNFGLANALTLNGTGVGGIGAVTNSSGTGNPTASGTVALASNTTVGVPNNYTFSGVVSGAFSLTKIGAAQLNLNAANTFSGGLIINAGAVATTNGDLGFGAANTAINMTGTGVSAVDNVGATVTDTHLFTFGANTTATLQILQNQKWLFQSANNFTGPSTATITRSTQSAGGSIVNDLQLAAGSVNSNYSGAWILQGGVTEVQGVKALGDGSATNTVTLNNTLAASVDELAAVTLPQNIIIASTSLASSLGADNAASTFSGSITANAPFNLRLGNFFNTTAENVTLSGPLSGSGVMTITSGSFAGTSLTGQVLTLSGNNSGYTAAITIPAGAVIAAANVNALGDTTSGTTITALSALDVQAAITGEPITLGAGAQTGIGSTGAIRNSSATNGSLDSAISLTGTTTPTIGVSGAGNLTLSGAITQGTTIGLTKVGAGAGSLILTNPGNTFASLNVLAGTVQGTAAGSLGTGTVTVGDVTGAANAALQLGGTTSFTLTNPIATGTTVNTGTVTLGGVNPSGTTVTYGGALTINKNVILNSTNAGAFTAFTNPITGAFSVTKTGAGNVTLGGANTYTGSTTVSAGVLNITGAVGNTTVTVATGATLSGSGTVGAGGTSTVTISSGGKLAPSFLTAAAPKLLTVNDATLSLSAGSIYSIQIAGPSAQGVSYDAVAFSGTASAAGSIVIADSTYASSSPTVGDKFFILDGSTAGSIAGTNGFATGTVVTGSSGITYTVTDNAVGDPLGTGNDILLTTASVPEPASLGLVGLGAVGLLARRRRRA